LLPIGKACDPHVSSVDLPARPDLPLDIAMGSGCN
jgi:hypothetical protein